MRNERKRSGVNPATTVRQMESYTVSESASLSNQKKNDFLKLDWNELTQQPSPEVARRLEEFVEEGHFEYYPDVVARDLREDIAKYVGTTSDHVQVFNGSDDAIRSILDAFMEPGNTFLTREPTYTQPYTFVHANGGELMRFTGPTPFAKTIDKYVTLLRHHDVKVTYIANPNNPTGLQYSTQELERLVEHYPDTLFVIDEAYYEFSGETAIELVEKYDNVVITRTFSKAFGLAGLRIGYVVASPKLLETINKVRNGKSVNVFAQVGASAALDDISYMESNVAEMKEAREWFTSALRDLGVQVHATCANYVLLRVGDVDTMMEELKEANVLVRDRRSLPQLSKSVRISVGTMDQMQECFQMISELSERTLGTAKMSK